MYFFESLHNIRWEWVIGFCLFLKFLKVFREFVVVVSREQEEKSTTPELNNERHDEKFEKEVYQIQVRKFDHEEIHFHLGTLVFQGSLAVIDWNSRDNVRKKKKRSRRFFEGAHCS